ncbi:4-diphosphocytidyl-2-C-methyl-D-erythritol kinase, putative, partial [Hepatocystis sp. ex Piliocolobus tephrosceles]
MNYCVKIKALICLYIYLHFTTTGLVSVSIRNNKCAKISHKSFNPNVLIFHFLNTYNNNFNSNKIVLKSKEQEKSNLCKYENRVQWKKKKNYTLLNSNVKKIDIISKDDITKKGNVLCNEKKKLIAQLLNRTKWYNYKFFSPAKINLFIRLKKKKKTYNTLSTLMHSINLGDDIFITVLNKDDRKKLDQVLYPCLSGDYLTINKHVQQKSTASENGKENNMTYNRVSNENKDHHTGRIKETSSNTNITSLFYNNYPLNDNNIIIKVLNKHRQELRKNNNYDDDVKFLVHVNKRIPIFSGIGGGSSNGATVFYFLEKYFYKNFKSKKSQNKFLQTIGSDISFFISTGFAYCMVKGNDVIDLKNIEMKLYKKKIYIFKINIGLSSKLVYDNVNYKKIVQYNPISLLKQFINVKSNNKHYNDIINKIKKKEKPYIKDFINLESSNLKNLSLNDLEHSAFILVEKLKKLKKILTKQNMFSVVSMSGSGTSLFAITKNDDIKYSNLEKKEIINLAKNAKKKLNIAMKVYLCEFLKKGENVWYKPKTMAERI